jgi:hypothetical protein
MEIDTVDESVARANKNSLSLQRMPDDVKDGGVGASIEGS